MPDSQQSSLGSAGACPEIVFQGKTWRIGHPTQRAKSALEELATAKAVAEVRALKTIVPADAYGELFSELATRVSAGDYRTWGAGWQRIIFTPANAYMFLLSLLRERHPDATEADAQALASNCREEVELALARVVPDFFTMLVDCQRDMTAEQKATVMAALRPLFAKLAPQATPTPPGPG